MKKKNTLGKLTLLFLGVMFCMSSVFSQERLPVDAITPEWTFFKEVKGVKFYIKEELFDTKDGRIPLNYVVVKLENTTNKELKLLYNLEVYYNLGCNNCNQNSESRQLITLAPKAVKEGRIEDGNTPLSSLLINKNLNNGWIPEYISLGNLIIN